MGKGRPIGHRVDQQEAIPFSDMLGAKSCVFLQANIVQDFKLAILPVNVRVDFLSCWIADGGKLSGGLI